MTRTLRPLLAWSTAQHPAAGMAEHTGAGVYYGAAATEAPAFTAAACSSSAAATRRARPPCIFRATPTDVQIVVRRDSLLDTMSRYLIEQIEKTPNIRLRTRIELERVEAATATSNTSRSGRKTGPASRSRWMPSSCSSGTKPRS